MSDATATERADFERALEAHRPAVLAKLRQRIDRALAARLDADELFNDVALEAWRRRDYFHNLPPARVRGWLYTLADHRYIDAYRRHTCHERNARRDQAWPDDSSIAGLLRLAASDARPSAAAIRSEDLARLRDALDMLDDADRAVIQLRQFKGLSAAEAGEQLGITAAAVHTRYSRALIQLRAAWDELERPWGDES